MASPDAQKTFSLHSKSFIPFKNFLREIWKKTSKKMENIVYVHRSMHLPQNILLATIQSTIFRAKQYLP